MPRYELMYILASSVSDDQVPGVASQIVKFVSDFGGTDVVETQLGKKKLAYPIKKTRNGFYGLIEFSMETAKVADFDAKIRTQNTIIRYIMVNLDEHIKRTAKDADVQAKMNRNRPQERIDEDRNANIQPAPGSGKPETKPQSKREDKPVEKVVKVEKEKAPVVEMNEEELDKKIDAALSEDILK